MNIEELRDGRTLTLTLSGKLSVMTAPRLEEAIKLGADDTDTLVLDIAALDYISSAGLRVLMAAQKCMNAKAGVMRILHPQPTVAEVFEMTGLSDVFSIE